MIGLNLSYKIYSGIDVVPEDIGRVLSVSRNSILLETASGELTISNSKKMINGMLPVIGDWCVINSDRTTVSKILCRKNVVSRKVSGTQLYLFHVLNSLEVKKYFRSVAKTTTNISNITFEDLGNLVLPLPGLDEQLKIIDELNRYQEIIVGAKKIVNNYLPKLPSYEIVVSTSLNDSELFDIQSGGTPSTKNPDYWD
jgi:type I restriction-modification system methyltransferase subunit